ncbi:MAG TPA: hypothetical protein VFJ97_14200 [Dermatophilaceae bacterium]|nr:hypothetical protein [Dermatophilaceae bacterium]
MSDDALPGELRALGQAVPGAPAGFVDDVMSRVVAARPDGRPVASRPDRRGIPRRWRVAVAVPLLLLALVALVPPVRAEVASWFGIEVRSAPGPAPSTAPAPPAARGTSLTEAARRVGFTPSVPTALGPPAGVEVSPDRRVVSMTWERPGGRVRLDQFAGSLSPLFVKSVFDAAEYVAVRGDTGLWFARPHLVQVIDRSGAEHVLPARPARATLVWQAGGLTLRLEGIGTREEAVAVASS